MHHVSPHKKPLIAGFKQISGVSIGVPWYRQCVDAGEHLPVVEKTKPIAISIEYPTRHREISACAFAGATQVPVVLPEPDLASMHDQFGIRKRDLSCTVHEPPDMVGMRVGQQDGVDRGGLDTGKREVRPELAAPLPEPARPGIDEHGAARAA